MTMASLEPPVHATGAKLPDDFAVTPLQYIDLAAPNADGNARLGLVSPADVLCGRVLLSDLGAEKALERDRYDAARTLTPEVTR
jgi:hypothetical protein